MAGAEASDLEAIIAEALNAGKGWSEEERRAYIDAIPDDLPIFADSLSKVDPAFAEAMRALTYEDETPESLAAHFKEQGNSRFKRGRNNRMYYKHAAGFYSEALKNAELIADGPEARAVRAALHANRAAAHLALGNFGSCRNDCDASLALVPGNVKCFYRKAKALAGLRRHTDALIVCEEGLAIDGTSKELTALRQECVSAIAAAAERERTRAARVRAEYEEVAAVWRHSSEAGIKLGPSAFVESHHRRTAGLLPVFEEEEDEWRWPLLLLYPQHSQSDFIDAAAENDPLGAHLAQAFPIEGPPAPWDPAGEYRCDRLEMYARLGATAPFRSLRDCIADWERRKAQRGEGKGAKDTIDDDEASERYDGGSGEEEYLRVGPGCSLLQLLKSDRMVVAGMEPSLLVLPREGTAHEHFLRVHKGRIRELPP